MAAALGITPQAVGRIERHSNDPADEAAVRMRLALENKVMEFGGSS